MGTGMKETTKELSTMGWQNCRYQTDNMDIKLTNRIRQTCGGTSISIFILKKTIICIIKFFDQQDQTFETLATFFYCRFQTLELEVDFININERRFLLTQNEKPSLSIGIWQMAHKFGKRHTKIDKQLTILRLKFGAQ